MPDDYLPVMRRGNLLDDQQTQPVTLCGGRAVADHIVGHRIQFLELFIVRADPVVDSDHALVLGP